MAMLETQRSQRVVQDLMKSKEHWVFVELEGNGGVDVMTSAQIACGGVR
jgi:hypothetical protein